MQPAASEILRATRDAGLRAWNRASDAISGYCLDTIGRVRHEGVRAILPLIFLVAGAGLLLYVGIEYGTMFSEQHRLEQQFAMQNLPPALRQASAPATNPDDVLTRVTAPRIGLDAIVVEGTSRDDLLVGPGHMTDSALPGENGNVVITGHRDTFFRHIYELNKGDEILVERNGKVFHYEVTGKKIVDPTDISVAKPTPDARLTLITCYPTYYIGPAPQRLVVFAKLVKQEPSSPRAVTVSTSGGAE
jgi:sortase A